MTKKRPAESKPVRSEDRHATGMMVRLDTAIHQQLKTLAERNNRPLTRELRALVIRHLEENGLWPPPDQPEG